MFEALLAEYQPSRGRLVLAWIAAAHAVGLVVQADGLAVRILRLYLIFCPPADFDDLVIF